MFRVKQLMIVTIVMSFSAAASADVINFTQMADAGGTHGESAWDSLVLSFAGGTVTITGAGPNGTAYAYLDKGNAGLGVCKDLNSFGDSNKNTLMPGSGLNMCAPGSDDNMTTGEILTFTFNVDVLIDNFWFNNNHDGGFVANDTLLIDGIERAVGLGIVGGAGGIGPFSVLAGQSITVAFGGTQANQFYVAGMDVNTVPEPATLFLLGAGLLGIGARRRMKAKA